MRGSEGDTNRDKMVNLYGLFYFMGILPKIDGGNACF